MSFCFSSRGLSGSLWPLLDTLRTTFGAQTYILTVRIQVDRGLGAINIQSMWDNSIWRKIGAGIEKGLTGDWTMGEMEFFQIEGQSLQAWLWTYNFVPEWIIKKRIGWPSINLGMNSPVSQRMDLFQPFMNTWGFVLDGYGVLILS